MTSERTLDSFDDDYFKIQINSIDSYLTLVSALDQQLPPSKAAAAAAAMAVAPPGSNSPEYERTTVVRVFGQVPTGHTICVHIHGFLPYFYVQLLHGNDGFKSLEDVNKFAIKLHNQLEDLVHLSFKRKKLNPDDFKHGEATAMDHGKAPVSGVANGDGRGINNDANANGTNTNTNNTRQKFKYIASVLPCKAVPFYGYHVGYSVFFKVSFLNPIYKNRIITVLESHEMPFRFKTYEANVALPLQFTSDFNLFGCGWMLVKKCFFRYPVFNTADEFYQMKINDEIIDYTNKYITTNNILNQQQQQKQGMAKKNQFSRISNTFLEIDISAEWIANRDVLTVRNLHHDFVEKLTPGLNKDFKYISSTRELWKDGAYQRQIRNLKSYKVEDPFKRNVSPDMISWTEQSELNDIFKYCLLSSAEKVSGHFKENKFDNFVKQPDFFKFLKTPFELVGIHFPQIANLDEKVAAEVSQEQNEALLENPIFENDIGELEDLDKFSNSDNDIDNDKGLISEGGSDDDFFKADGEDNEEPYSSNQVPDGKISTLGKTENVIDNAKDTLVNEHDSKNGKYRLESIKNARENISFDDMSFSLNDTARAPKSKKRKSSSLGLHLTKSSSFNSFHSIRNIFPTKPGTNIIGYAIPPPPILDIKHNLEKLILPQHDYLDPFYGKTKDVPAVPYVSHNKRFRLETMELEHLKGLEFNNQSISKQMRIYSGKNYERLLIKQNNKIIQSGFESQSSKFYKYCAPKPSFKGISDTLDKVPSSDKMSTFDKKRMIYSSQIEYLTPKLSRFRNSASQIRKVKRRPDGYNNLSLLTVELHINSRLNMTPDPQHDKVAAVFWKIHTNSISLDLDIVDQGILILSDDENEDIKVFSSLTDVAIEVFDNEMDLFKELVSLVKLFDPDILAGYELHGLSWGYIIDRCRVYYEYDISKDLARVSSFANNKAKDFYGFTHAAAMVITGRHMVNIWRLIRDEIALTSYTLENVVFNVLKQRIPHFSFNKLSQIFRKKQPSELAALLNYYIKRVNYNITLLESLDVIFKIVEQARLGGIDFYSVFYRGSQYKVESFLLRISKAQNFLLLSPNRKQVRKQKPLECIPLVMEPASGYYKSPLVVLDFQSLYPSVIIAYNYCYSTCLGRIRGFDPTKSRRLGVNNFDLPDGLLNLLKNDMFLSPNGLMFVKPEVRKSLLAKMLEEILETRFMLKSTMKFFKGGATADKDMYRLYDSRQLALKLIANVTYGYTSATFSGRMPCSDIADAIVQTGRETLERSINFIESVKEWNAKVVYGDTDSLFVYLPGRSKEDAFKIGRDIAHQVTEANPKPITLKFEKVYHSSVLLAKKRYVGYMYESEDQKEPVFDAKGIETVRRDGIPAQQKVTEKALRILFETADISKIKEYVKNQFFKIMSNKVSIKDFCFAKEVKIGTYKSEKSMPPGALLVTKKMNMDIGYEPQYKERVPYVIMRRHHNDRLRDKAILLEDIAKQPNFQLDSEYYITKMLIPPLDRIFSLIGVDVKEWYYEMPRYFKYDDIDQAKAGVGNHNNNGGHRNGNRRIAANQDDFSLDAKMRNVNLLQKFLQVEKCVNCHKNINKKHQQQRSINGNGNSKVTTKLCEDCAANEPETLFQIMNKVKHQQIQMSKLYTICRDCSVNQLNAAGVFEIWCDSGDCPIYYSRIKAEQKLLTTYKVMEQLEM